MNRVRNQWDRRHFLAAGGTCSAWLLAMLRTSRPWVRSVFQEPQENERLFEEKWGWIEKLSENVWSHISTPFDGGDFTTVSNGGIVAGRDRVLAIESFQKPEGARWLAQRARELTGRWPTDVVITHFHGDHASGSSGYRSESATPEMWVTRKTKELLEGSDNPQSNPLLPKLSVIDDRGLTELDLGGTKVTLNATSGHTPSDVMIRVVDPNIVFTGDLFWNKLVPNFRDADPVQLTGAIENLLESGGSRFVPGHGPMSTLDDVERFQRFLKMMQEAATRAFNAGTGASVAAAEFKLTGEFEDWYIFADSVVPRIFSAWYDALNQQQ